jgi:hypothetical protein
MAVSMMPWAIGISSPPPACARTWMAQVASKVYISWNASATVLPTVSSP